MTLTSPALEVTADELMTVAAVREPRDRALAATEIHPGVDVDTVGARTGWSPRVAAELRRTQPPSAQQLSVPRAIGAA